MIRERLKRYRDRFAAGILWSILLGGIYQDEPPPAWLNTILDQTPDDVQVEFWKRCCAAGIAHADQEYFDPCFSSMEGTFYVMWRRASGRTAPVAWDWLFGWREMHPCSDP